MHGLLGATHRLLAGLAWRTAHTQGPGRVCMHVMCECNKKRPSPGDAAAYSRACVLVHGRRACAVWLVEWCLKGLAACACM